MRGAALLPDKSMNRGCQQTADLSVPDSPKSLGAFYTDAQVADFLVWWAVRSGSQTVLDPGFGGGVFLRSACKRLKDLNGNPSNQVFGVEIDADVYSRIADKLRDEFSINKRHLVLADFFDVDGKRMSPVDAVVGNPPFIRYQRFSGEARKKGLRCAAQQGIRLGELCSSWAPFLVHSVSMLKSGGRLAMVIPVEISHASYALPVVKYLSRSFRRVTFLTFRKKLFPDLSEGTLLLLGEDRGPHDGEFLWSDLSHPGRLAEIQRLDLRSIPGARAVDAVNLSNGCERLIENFIPRKARELYRELRGLEMTRRLGSLVDIGIGYVTGANGFFHLDSNQIRLRGIPKRYLKPAVRRGRALLGLRFTEEDWRQALANGEGSYLLYIDEECGLPESVLCYLKDGEARGVHKAYKCRTRTPWFRVPHVYRGDAFLTYMSGATPRLVANDARVIAPNSLHVVRARSGCTLRGDALAALWQTSLTRLSAEIEGHPLGGGMLKLEPREAESVVIASPPSDASLLVDLAQELDAMVRRGLEKEAQLRADEAILQQGIGMHRAECEWLRKAALTLRERRYLRSTLN